MWRFTASSHVRCFALLFALALASSRLHPDDIAAQGRAATASEFDKYPGEEPLTSEPAAPQMSLPKARKYRTVLRRAAMDGPNFNGHYRTVLWGCGTNCVEWASFD